MLRPKLDRPGPAGFRNFQRAWDGPSDKDARLCEVLCRNEEGEIEHRASCRIGIVRANQAVTTRQVRRTYAREMAKRER
jgi:hypothetical protein